MEIRGNTNTGKTNQGNQTFHSKKLSFPSYNLRFIEIERRAVTVKKSFKKKEAIIERLRQW